MAQKKFLDSEGLQYTLQGISNQLNLKTNTAISTCKTYTDTKITALVNQAPDSLNTLKKIADAINTHQEEFDGYVINIASQLSNKSDKNHIHDVVTVTVNGFMSAEDKVKLNGIATGANKTIVDSELSDTSTNPVQNKVIKAALDTKSDNHSHNAYINQNAFSKVSISGTTTLEADSPTDTFTVNAGSNISLTAVDSSDSFTITAVDEKVKTTEANTTKLYLTGCLGANTSTLNYDSNVYLSTTAGHLTATQFNGALNGNANTSTTATTANKTAQSITIKLNGGSTEGTNLFTFNGSTAKSIDITPSLVGSPSTSTFESAVAQATDAEVLAMLESILG